MFYVSQLNVVEFQSGSEKYQDIVEQEKLRLPNNRLATHTLFHPLHSNLIPFQPPTL